MNTMVFKLHLYSNASDAYKACKFRGEVTIRNGAGEHILDYRTEELRPTHEMAFKDAIDKAMQLAKIFKNVANGPINFVYEAGF